jgi:predicted DNA-binding transcriptional regulator AlpA
LQLPPEYRAIILRHDCRIDRAALDAQKTATKFNVGVSTLWREVALKRFVPPIRLSQRRVGWIESEVDALIEAKTLITRQSDHNFDIRVFVAALIERL